ncbi:MAG: hypothetical protein U0169_00550 [Polyangiaceae bacterium]
MGGGCAAAKSDEVISSGIDFTCFVTKDSIAKCWGWNAFGKVGNGTYNQTNAPTEVKNLGGSVVAVGAGLNHACAVKADGHAFCWGSNDEGQLGSSTEPSGPNQSSPVPVAVDNLLDAATISAGSSSTCVLTKGGGAKCWGRGLNGEIGNGSTTRASTPVSVTGLATGVVAVRAGWSFACALTDSGALKCWGSNEYGKLGNPSASGSSKVPVDVSGMTQDVAAFDVGNHAGCAVKTDGTVWCWGRGLEGIPGQANNRDAPSPVQISGIPGLARDVSVGTDHACALLRSGTLHCWGDNDYGAHGIAALALPVAAVSSASEFSCAVLTRGVVRCAGRGSSGQLGDDQASASSSPVKVFGL